MSGDRPDLCHAVRGLASSMRSPRTGDWLRLKKVVRYLVKRPYMKRVFKVQSDEDYKVNGRRDADWSGDLKTRRSVSGLVVATGKHVVMVKSTSQTVVALSSAESGY